MQLSTDTLTDSEPAPLIRCGWARSPQMMLYHDEEWGVPLYDDQKLFEFLILEGAQAGLSWETVLKKRAAYREAFDQFDAARIATYDQRKIEQLLANEQIIRNRLKIAAATQNAKAFLAIRAEYGTFANYIWQFVGGQPRTNTRRTLADIPATTPESDAMSKALKKRGFTFVGSTICYAFMQATGMVNDHTLDCFRYQQVDKDTQPTITKDTP
ncbi:MAG TPA: DNA-3-methyladenine glycosylase I [Ktedonobacterales bacterium]|nr:DNA-3-methyladenine glycosylase I [Ktedonobacterales bacterium]